MECPACARPVPPGSRFCPSCGHTLTVAGTAIEERRVVTVLFADLVGFTALAEHRDPEQVKRMVDAAFGELRVDVEAFGGRVDKVLGDAILALFGAPVAHEDDAERAVRTALQMHTTLARFVEEHSVDFDVALRVGINTGEVLVGSLAGTDYTAMGDVVNTAARLQTIALPGGVVVGDATRRLCSDAITFDALDSTELRGRQRREQAWLVRSAEPAHRRAGRARTPFVGRSLELTLLGTLVERVRRGRSAVVAVTGEAGIGKTRLVNEVLRALQAEEPDLGLIEGSCPPYGDSNVWAPIAGGLAEQFGIDRTADAVAVRARLVEQAIEVFGVDPDSTGHRQDVEAALHLLGFPSALDRLDPAAARDVLFAGAVEVVRRRARVGPVVVWVDDLQWAHAMLADLLLVIARSVPDLPVLIITTSRPVEDAMWPASLDRTTVLHLSLGPLDPEESAELVDRVLDGRSDPWFAEQLAERSGGNPLFLTELALLTAEESGTDPMSDLPGSLRALIASRLDQLDPEVREVVDNAAILGSQGSVAALEEFASAMNQRWDPGYLDHVVAQGMIETDENRWRFRSDLVREVAYQTLTKQARAQRHAGVATVMAGHLEAPIDQIAHHAASAAELIGELGAVPGVEPRVAPWAVDLLREAARRTYDLGGFRHGVGLTERALALVADDAETRRQLLLLHAEGLVELRRGEEARTDLHLVLADAGADGDLISAGEAHRLLGAVDQLLGNLIAARAQLGTAVDMFRQLGDEARLARALRDRGFAEVFGGSLQDAEWYLGEADALSQRLGDVRGRAWVTQHRAWISFLGGEYEEAEQRLRTSIIAFDQMGDRSGGNWARGLLAFVMYVQRRFDEADALAGEVLIEARRWGDDWGSSMMLALRADLRLWSGQFAEAAELAERALAGFRRVGDRFGLVQAMAPLARARVAQGRAADAGRGIEEILSIADALGAMAYPTLAASGIAMHLGEGRRAAALAQESLDRMVATGSSLAEARVHLAIAKLQCGDPDAAVAALLDADVESSPFALAARALVLTALGDFDAAMRDARAALEMEGATYFDRSLATLATAAVASRTGADDLDGQLRALRELSASGDVVLGSVLRDAAARIEGQSASSSLPLGWRTVLDAVTVAMAEDGR